MLDWIQHTILYDVLYNILIFLVSIMPRGDVGLAVIVLTILVKLVLFPFNQKSIKSQIRLKALGPEIQKIKETCQDKQEQAKKTFDLYKAHKVNPFSGCLPVIIQIIIIFPLYFVFWKGLGSNGEALYPFIQFPENLNMRFLGLIDMLDKSLFLALLAGLSQFLQAKTSAMTPQSGDGKKGLQAELMKGMGMQFKYIFPVLVAFFAYQVSSAVALYWVTSNIIAIIQEKIVRKKFIPLSLNKNDSGSIKGNY